MADENELYTAFFVKRMNNIIKNISNYTSLELEEELEYLKSSIPKIALKIVEEPEFDKEGDITENTFFTILKWDYKKGWKEFYDFIKECFDLNYGVFKINENTITISTGGWSCNERVMMAIDKNFMFMSLFWISTQRGGNYEYKSIENVE